MCCKVQIQHGNCGEVDLTVLLWGLLLIFLILCRVGFRMPVPRTVLVHVNAFLGHGAPLRYTPRGCGWLGLLLTAQSRWPQGRQAFLGPARSKCRKGHRTGGLLLLGCSHVCVSLYVEWNEIWHIWVKTGFPTMNDLKVKKWKKLDGWSHTVDVHGGHLSFWPTPPPCGFGELLLTPFLG